MGTYVPALSVSHAAHSIDALWVDRRCEPHSRPGTVRVPPGSSRVDVHHSVHSTHFGARLAAWKPLHKPAVLPRPAWCANPRCSCSRNRASDPHLYPSAPPYTDHLTFLTPSHPYLSSTIHTQSSSSPFVSHFLYTHSIHLFHIIRVACVAVVFTTSRLSSG